MLEIHEIGKSYAANLLIYWKSIKWGKLCGKSINLFQIHKIGKSYAANLLFYLEIDEIGKSYAANLLIN